MALPRSFIEAKKKAIGKFNALVGFALSSHEEGIVVLIQQPRLQVAANTRDEMSSQTHWGLQANLSPSKNSRFHELIFVFNSLKLARNTSSALPISLSRT